jgi:hypothetical protein
MPEQDSRKRLHSSKEQLLHRVRVALDEAGLDEYDVKSIGLYLKHSPVVCPEGQEAVWGPTTQPDGTVEYRWVCK